MISYFISAKGLLCLEGMCKSCLYMILLERFVVALGIDILYKWNG